MDLNKRNYYYDVMRIVACFLVILNHTSYVFERYGEMKSINWIISSYLFFLCKTAVPIFIMLSGALLLKKEEGYIQILKNRIFKMIIVIIIWTVIYESVILNKVLNINEVINALKNAVKVPIYIHFWYLYMLIGLYIMTPFLKKMIRQFENKDYIIFLSIWFAVSCLVPFINLIYKVEVASYFKIPIFTGYLGFYILGFYLDNLKIDSKLLKWAIIILIGTISLSVFMTLHYSSSIGKTWTLLDQVLMAPIAISSLSLFIIIKYIALKYSIQINKFENIIINLSTSTFGIYIVHMLVISKLYTTQIEEILLTKINPIIGTIILDFIIFGISYLIVSALKKIYILNKYV